MVGINQFLLDNRVGKSTFTVSGKLCINTTMLVIVNSGTMCLESRLCPAHPKEEAASSNSLRSCCISPGNMGGRHRLCALEKSREKKSFKSDKYLSEGWLINNYVWSTHCKSFLNLHRQFAIGSRWSLFLSKNIFFLVNYDIFTITFKKKPGWKLQSVNLSFKSDAPKMIPQEPEATTWPLLGNFQNVVKESDETVWWRY